MMSMGSPEDNLPIQLDAGVMVAVDNFTYLRSNITNDSEVTNEVGVRLGRQLELSDAFDPPSLIIRHSV